MNPTRTVWRLRVKRDVGVRFELAGERVESMKLLQEGQEMVFTRAKGTKPAPAIDLAAIDRVRRSA